jgi:hypothetical protein
MKKTERKELTLRSKGQKSFANSVNNGEKEKIINGSGNIRKKYIVS